MKLPPPLTVAVKRIGSPGQMALHGVDIVTTGAICVLTTTVTDEEAVHPVKAFTAVRVYTVVCCGLATGFGIAGSLKPIAGDQEYEIPASPCTPIWMDAPLQMLKLDAWATVGNGFTFIVTLPVLEHPFKVAVKKYSYIPAGNVFKVVVCAVV